MNKDDLKKKLIADREHPSQGEDEDVSLVSVEALPKLTCSRRTLHRAIGFWPATIEKCRNLETGQAIKVRLLKGEQPTNFAATARSVAKNLGFYLNTVFKYPFMYLWPDRMRGRVLPEDFNSKGATFFENEEEIE